MDPNFDAASPDQKPLVLDGSGLSPLASQQELHTALSQMGIAGLGDHAGAAPLDATLMLSEIMGMSNMDAVSAGSASVSSAGSGIGGGNVGQAQFLTAMPDQSFMTCFSGLNPVACSVGSAVGTSSAATVTAADMAAAGLPAHIAFNQVQLPLIGLPSNQFALPAMQHVHQPGLGIMAQPAASSSLGAVGFSPAVASASSMGQAPATAGLQRGQVAAGHSVAAAGGGGATGLSTAGSLASIQVPSPGSSSQYEEDELKKREMHNFIERRRRYNINDRIKELGNLLPGTEPDSRQNKGNILKTAVSYIKRLQKIEARYRDLSRKHRQYAKTLTVFKSRLEEYDAACQSHGMVVPSASQEAALLTRVDLARVTLDQCVTLVDCLESTGSEVSDVTSLSSMGQISDDEGWSEDDDVRSNASAHSTGSARRLQAIAPRT